MRLLTDAQLRRLRPAASAAFASPVPTQIVASDEWWPPRQTAEQHRVERKLKELGAALARHQGMSRRRFFQTAAGMAAAFHVMNEVHGPCFAASAAEAAKPEEAEER